MRSPALPFGAVLIASSLLACAGAQMPRAGAEGDELGGDDSGETGHTDATGAGEDSSGAGTTGPGGTTLTTAADDDSGPTSASSATQGESSTGAMDEGSSGGLDSAGSSDGGGSSSEGGGGSSSGGAETGVGLDVDLSGWIVVQANSAREIVIPDGTVVPAGGTLVIGRNAAPGAFQDFWGANWGAEVVYVDGLDDFPTINGDETYTLQTPETTVIDGPTAALELATGALRNDADLDAGNAAAWDVTLAPNLEATPGSSSATGGTPGIPYISEVVDTTGAGNFPYEYVEIHVPG